MYPVLLYIVRSAGRTEASIITTTTGMWRWLGCVHTTDSSLTCYPDLTVYNKSKKNCMELHFVQAD